MRTLTSLLGNRQQLDGGAMFGHVPRALWSHWATPDAAHRIPLACRALLIREMADAQPRTILCETGIGAFMAPAMRDRYGVVESEHVLLDSLEAVGLSHEDIDVVVLSHLHFDHAGGLLSAWREGEPASLLFPRATFVVSRGAWERACSPHPRDRASFIPELPELLRASGRLEIVDGPTSATLGDAYRLHRSEGHTPDLLLVEVPMPDGPVVFAGDLIPGIPWLHVPVTMGYDRFPERLVEEKQALLGDLHTRSGRLFFTHDPDIALATLQRDARGRYQAGHTTPALHEVTR